MKRFDESVVPYVLGLLDEEHARNLEQTMSEDESLQRRVTAVEQRLDQLANDEDAMVAIQSVRTRLLDSVAKDVPMTAMLPRLQQLFDIASEQAQALLAAARDPSSKRWQSAGVAGAQLLHLQGGPTLAQADCGLVRLEPGAVFPLHEHLGDEWALVLDGCIGEVGGRSFNAGDVAFSAAGSRHALETLGNQSVVLATVNFEGIRVQGSASSAGK